MYITRKGRVSVTLTGRWEALPLLLTTEYARLPTFSVFEAKSFEDMKDTLKIEQTSSKRMAGFSAFKLVSVVCGAAGEGGVGEARIVRFPAKGG